MHISDFRYSWLTAKTRDLEFHTLFDLLKQHVADNKEESFQVHETGPKLDLSGLHDGNGLLAINASYLELGLKLRNGDIQGHYVKIDGEPLPSFGSEPLPARFAEVFRDAAMDTVIGFRSIAPAIEAKLGDLVRQRETVVTQAHPALSVA